MHKTKKKALSLNKEYLRLLNARDLSQARGGLQGNGNGSTYVMCDATACECGGGE